MYNYTWYQWILLFFCYCFVGWCFESTIKSVQAKKFINRGFLNGPMLPIYGFGAIFILLATIPVQKSPSLVFLFGMTAATLLELVTGYVMEKLFKVRYWDYSYRSINYKGYICLNSSLAWGILSIFLLEFINPFFEDIVMPIPKTIAIILVFVLMTTFIIDLVVSAKTALDLSKVIAQMNQIKVQLDEIGASVKTRSEMLEEKFINDLESKKEKLTSDYNNLINTFKGLKSSLVKRNPSSTSSKFYKEFQELKDKLKDTINL